MTTKTATLVGKVLTLTYTDKDIPEVVDVTWPDGVTYPGAMLPDKDVCPEVAALLKRACWARLHADRPLWYSPALIRSGLYDRDKKIKEARDAAAREKGRRIAAERAAAKAAKDEVEK